jgi:hypothetical protein
VICASAPRRTDAYNIARSLANFFFFSTALLCLVSDNGD